MIIKSNLEIYSLREQKFICDLIFDRGEIKEETINSLNLDEVIKFLSNHLLIPLFYFKIQKKKLINLFPSDFSDYLREIFLINKSRNEKLLEEVSIISKILKKNKIKHVFLKGSALILSKIYDDIGERMIGDVDLLVSEEASYLAFELLKKNGYISSEKYLFWKTRHLPRLTNPEKLFAVEIHTELLYYKRRNQFKAEEMLNKVNENIIPTNNDLIRHCILNDQINNLGNKRASFTFRSMVDFFVIYKKKPIKLNTENNYFKRFIIFTNYLGITSIKMKLTFFDKVYCVRASLKMKRKFYYKFDEFISLFIFELNKKLMQVLEFMFNKPYRIRVLKKLKNKTNQ